MRTFKSGNGVILILVVLFFLPGLSALWCYFHPQLLSGGLVNKGELIHVPVLVKELTPSKTWQLVYVPEEACGLHCLNALDQLAKVRLSLGRHLYGLSLHLLVLPHLDVPDSTTKKQLKEMDIHMGTIKARPKALAHNQVWIVNPKGYVVMVYQDESHPKDIFSDLQHFSPLWG